jgi:hypothetical protein
MIPEARACSYQLHTTQPYLTNRTYRENAEALRSRLMAVGDKAGTLRGSELLDPQKAARLLLRGSRGCRPDSGALWGTAGAWTTGQQRSPTDHRGKRNSRIDLAKRQ